MNDGDMTPVIQAFSKFQGGLRVSVEWGIGGLQTKCRKFWGTFSKRRDKFGLMFWPCAILTNLVHRRRMDFKMEFIPFDGDVDGMWG